MGILSKIWNNGPGTNKNNEIIKMIEIEVGVITVAFLQKTAGWMYGLLENRQVGL